MKKLIFGLLGVVLAACSTSHSNKLSHAQTERDGLGAAADAGDAEAQYRMGNSWCCGDGVVLSTDEAVKWWCKAAAQGHSGAENAIAHVARTGEYGCATQENTSSADQ